MGFGAGADVAPQRPANLSAGRSGSLTLPESGPYGLVMNTVTRAHLAEQIYVQVGLSRNESADLLEHVLERLASVLEGGDSVKISGFGTFSVRQKGRRIGRNPKTGIEVPILPRSVLVFRPSQVMRASINGEKPPATDDVEDDR